MAEAATTKRKRTVPAPHATTDQPPVEAIPKQISFFQRVAAIDQADWGTRAKVTVYRLEPLIDRLRSSEKKYITVYNDGPPDEERIKQDHGSGRYRLYLGIKTAGHGQQEREIDSIEIDILDLKYPPNLDLGDWIDDPKNRRWAWAKRALEDKASKIAAAIPPAPPAPGDILTQLDTLDRLQDRAVERMKASAPTPPPPPPDTTMTALGMTKEILAITKGGGDTALIDMFRDEMKSLREQNIKLQDEARARANQPAPTPPDPLAQLTQLGDSVKKLREIGLFPAEKDEEGAISKAIRSKMPAWMEFLQPAVPEFLRTIQPITAALGARMAAGPQPQRPTQSPAPPPSTPTPQSITAPAEPQPQGPPKPLSEADEMLQFVLSITPKMVEYILTDQPGDTFAALLADYHSVERVQKMQKPLPADMVVFFKQTTAWEQLKDREQQLLRFWTEFKEWKPEEPEAEDGVERKDG